MSTLFDSDNTQAGFRLKHLELYNWGTFHEKIFRLSPGGKNSLLTGANGSGKTTVADALITLLVPPQKRHYNQSSGADRKRERDETSYFLGAYGNIKDDDSQAKTQYLRTKDDYSVILGVFFNESFQQEVTLVQIRWFSAGTLRRLYMVCTLGLEMERDLLPFDSGPQWKRRIGAAFPVKWFDTFPLYQQAFSGLFGFKSEKALSLFGHTVGVKVLGDLNDFIRENMLESPDMEEEFLGLRKNYEDLLGAHRQIEKAREQIRLLSPLRDRAGDWHVLKEKKGRLESSSLLMPPYMAKRFLGLLQDEKGREQSRFIAADSRKEDLEEEIETLRRQERDLDYSLRSKTPEDLLRTLEREEDHRRSLRDAKEKRAREYLSLGEKVGLGDISSEDSFWEARGKAEEYKHTLEDTLKAWEHRWADLRSEVRVLGEQEGFCRKELNEAQQRTGLISAKLAALRDRLARSLDREPSALPFAGEFMRCNHEDYQDLAEDLLQNLSRSIVLPRELEGAAQKLLDQWKPDVEVSFFLLNEGTPEGILQAQGSFLSDKLEFRYAGDWVPQLESQVRRSFDFLCTTDPRDFLHSDRAVLPPSLVKDGRLVRHLEPREDPLRLLGWDNGDLCRRLGIKLQKINQNLQEKEKELTDLEKKRQDGESRLLALEKLLDFQNFATLNYREEDRVLEEISQKRKDLSQGDGSLDALTGQLADLRLKIREKTREKEELISSISKIKGALEAYELEGVTHQQILEVQGEWDWVWAEELLVPYLTKQNKELTLETFQNVHEHILKALQSEEKTTLDQLKTLERLVESEMNKYLRPGTEILNQFPEWSGETSHLMAQIDYLGEFIKILDRVEREDLPGHQKRFKEWLNQRLLEDMADFKTSLENSQRQILDNVKELNSALKTITYNTLPPTYIELVVEETRDVEVREFRKLLKDALPSGGVGDLEEAFHRIRKLIQELSERENWRKRVMDVRSWLQFSVWERYTSDGAQKQYYQDSQSLSGGEKAKLAYTILASALAYQFSIRQDGVSSRSFRFVVVDEAFSKVDPENSRFAMNLFAQLNLQLMVVTPLDKLHVVEQHISTIHFVENRSRRHSSVYDLSIQEYRERSANR